MIYSLAEVCHILQCLATEIFHIYPPNQVNLFGYLIQRQSQPIFPEYSNIYQFHEWNVGNTGSMLIKFVFKCLTLLYQYIYIYIYMCYSICWTYQFIYINAINHLLKLVVCTTKCLSGASLARIFWHRIQSQSTIIKKKDKSKLWLYKASSYLTATAYHWIPSMVGGEFWNNIYAKQGKFLDKNVRK